MSLKSWREEFYYAPVDTPAVINGQPVYLHREMSMLQAVDHSLLKWEGTAPDNLKKHKVVFTPYSSLIGKDEEYQFFFTSATCSLCKKYFDEAKDTIKEQCGTCPIVKAGHKACTLRGSAYNKFMEKGETQPMIDVLRHTLVWVLEQE